MPSPSTAAAAVNQSRFAQKWSVRSMRSVSENAAYDASIAAVTAMARKACEL